jgi:hypothetical protein
MCGPPDAEMRSPAAANGRASRIAEYWKPGQITETTPKFKRDLCGDISQSDTA